MVVSKSQIFPRATCTSLVANALQSGRSSKLALKGVWHMVDSNVYRAVMRGELPNTKHYKWEEFLRWAVTKWPKIQAKFPDIRPLPNVVKVKASINIALTMKAALVKIPANHDVLRQRHQELQLYYQEEVSRLQQIIAEQAPKVLAYDNQQAGNLDRRLKSEGQPVSK